MVPLVPKLAVTTQENVSAFLVATDNGYLEQLTVNDNQPVISSPVGGLAPVQAGGWAGPGRTRRQRAGRSCWPA